MENVTSSSRMLGGIAATATLLAAGLAPVAATPAISPHVVVAVSAEVALAGNTVADGLAGLAAFDVPGAAAAFGMPGVAEALDLPGAADAFDIGGLINAEIAALQGMFNSLFSLPVTLFNDVQSMVTNLFDLNFGVAFSELVAIPQDIVNYVLGLPGMLINTAYQMAIVIPGEFLFNFG